MRHARLPQIAERKFITYLSVIRDSLPGNHVVDTQCMLDSADLLHSVPRLRCGALPVLLDPFSNETSKLSIRRLYKC